MKALSKKAIGCLCIAVCLLFSSCTASNTTPKENRYGNTNENMHSISLVAKQGKWLYMTMSNYKFVFELPAICRVSLDGKTVRLVRLTNAFNICVYDNYVFFTTMMLDSETSPLYRMTITGANRRRITSDNVNSYNIYNGKIYYANLPSGKEKKGIYSCDLNGSRKRLLAQGDIRGLDIINNRIYYCNEENGVRSLYVMDMDGSNKEIVYEGEWLTNIVIVDDVLYCIRYENTPQEFGRQLCKISLSDKEKKIEVIRERAPAEFHYVDGFLVTRAVDNTNRIMKISVKDYSVSYISVPTEYLWGINVHDGIIYCFTSSVGHDPIYFMNLDGEIVGYVEN